MQVDMSTVNATKKEAQEQGEQQESPHKSRERRNRSTIDFGSRRFELFSIYVGSFNF
jgi:hypothetical protein